MEPDESVIWVIDPEDYKADVLFVFENGRVVRVALSGYVTKTNRKRLKNAIYGGSKLLYARCSRRTATSRWSRATTA